MIFDLVFQRQSKRRNFRRILTKKQPLMAAEVLGRCFLFFHVFPLKSDI